MRKFSTGSTISLSVRSSYDRVEMWTILDNYAGVFSQEVHMTLRKKGSDPDGDLWSNTEAIQSLAECLRKQLEDGDRLRVVTVASCCRAEVFELGEWALENEIFGEDMENLMKGIVEAWDDIQKLVKLP